MITSKYYAIIQTVAVAGLAVLGVFATFGSASAAEPATADTVVYADDLAYGMAQDYALFSTMFQTTTVPTLAVDSATIQVGLFSGANVILVALGSIFFLLLGFAFGGKILKAIGDFIMRFSF